MVAQFRVHHNGALRTIKTAWIRQAGVLRRLKTAKVMDDGELRLVGVFTPPLSLSISPAAISASGSNAPFPETVTTSAATAVPQGGAAPFTYTWSIVSGGPLAILAPTSASTQFAASLFPGEIRTAVCRCTVTDNIGAVASANVSVALTRI